MINEVIRQVKEILENDNSGHDYYHTERVYKLAIKFAESENANKEIVSLIALLHDVDDYKLFGKEQAENLSNAKKIMNSVNISSDKQEIILESLRTMGYRNCVKGIRPKLIEGQIVSDADMCDAMGVNGILRTYRFGIKYGKEFFIKESNPYDMGVDHYKEKVAECSVYHMFEKLLKLKGLMITESGKKEASNRHEFMVSFLYELFDEENSEIWKKYLDEYLSTKI
jgi:uncharacterized protein